jgi:hypothetical protein
MINKVHHTRTGLLYDRLRNVNAVLVDDTKIEKKHVVFSERLFNSDRKTLLGVLQVRFASENLGPTGCVLLSVHRLQKAFRITHLVNINV